MNVHSCHNLFFVEHLPCTYVPVEECNILMHSDDCDMLTRFMCIWSPIIMNIYYNWSVREFCFEYPRILHCQCSLE